MKTLLSLIFLLITTQLQAKVWILNQAPGQYNHFTFLQVAIDSDDVLAGDTLYCLPGYNYGNLVTSKTIILIGPCHFISFDENTPFNRGSASAGTITINENAAGTSIIGMKILGNIFIFAIAFLYYALAGLG